MKRVRAPVLALIVVAVIFALLHFSGVLQWSQDARVPEAEPPSGQFDTIDIQQAMGVVTFDPPKMLNPPDKIPPLLL
jgi:hypothetical protein